MNGSKKFSIIGFVAIITVVSILASELMGFALSPVQDLNDEPHFIDVEYQPQRNSLFCGQASVQMVLNKVQERYVSQFRLQDEMKFIEGKGTVNSNLKHPFEERNIEIIKVGILSNPAHLRKSIDRSQYSIINIRFDEKSNFGHYVVVTGYNETGFFVHDPWPEAWGESVGRETGENAYIETPLLRRLWSYRLYWVITVAGSSSLLNSTQPEVVEVSVWA